MTADLVSTNSTDTSAIFSIAGVRYEYFFHSPEFLRRIEFLNKISGLKALNFAKRKALRVQKEQPNATHDQPHYGTH
jgi:hypothetical protein